MKKNKRQAKIEQIIQQQTIGTQEKLLAALEAEGIHATQATVSRDIREMQIVKERDSQGQLRYTIYHNGEKTVAERLDDTIAEVVVSIQQVEFVNVVTTAPGNGNSLAAIIDELTFPQIAGTIAGHDTILIISPDRQSARDIHDYFTQRLLVE
ncbi:arginine repressor [Loigolactobacillus rennini]|uniref:Arginine repressor n=2 Tax=Loigolactobacillus rennini TaxID=238013 RepID=A0A0R2CYG6_9LACO|nr:arginine repressor [Loigolactobacillus rennini]KRM93017.1 arginine repressor [Loigolactobacillus rennini DSM 20253]SFZ88298.1 Arginine pathway regulatory protein ArgR, repressor of arg regulon [Loigolactobacillus rennini]